MEDDFALTKNILVHTQNTNRRLYRQLKNSISIAMKILQDENLVKIEGKKVYIKKDELSSYFKST